MKSHSLAVELAILLLVCVLGIFLCPATVGPYAAVHGPVTAFRSLRAFMRVRWSMVVAAFRLFGLGTNFLPMQRLVAMACTLCADGYHENSILRC